MKSLKYSKQREAIKTFLLSRTDHPSANMVYEHIKQDSPHISLGTVYRNLNLLVEMHEAIKLTTKDGSDRYDARTMSHYHFICSACGCVKDLPMPPMVSIEQEASRYTQDTITHHEINFFGLCQHCTAEENESE